MRSDEIAGLGDLAGDAAAGLTRQIHELHSGVAGRVWRRVGPASLPVRIAHDRIARRAYAAAGELTRAVVRAGAHAASAAQASDSPSMQRSPAGRAVLSALNGAFGDTLERQGNALALPMAFRRGGRDLELARTALADAYPNAKRRLAVFVHGLCETDDAWKLGAARHVPYGHRMEIELGYSPLYLRYNTGRHISENGREFADTLESLIAAWPVPVDEVVLIGHSMGGLVARSACHYGADSNCVAKVRHVITLGTPHHGAPLEQVTNAASAALARLPETRPLARALNIRSSGIKDLRHGYLVDECWSDQDGDAYPSQHLARDPVPAHRAPLLHLRNALARGRWRRRPDHRRPARAPAERVGAPGAGQASELPDRALLPPRRRQPLRPAEPPGDLRADPPLHPAASERCRRRPSLHRR